MVKYSQSRLDGVFHALADPTRRSFVREVARGPRSLTELSKLGPISLPLASKHVAVLEQAGLVTSTKDGRVRTCNLKAGPLREASDWIRKYEAFWDAGLDRLAEYVENEWEETQNGSDR